MEGETCTAVELNSSLCHDISATYVYKSSLRKHRCTLPNKVISLPHYNRVHCTSTRPVDKCMAVQFCRYYERTYEAVYTGSTHSQHTVASGSLYIRMYIRTNIHITQSFWC